MMSSNGDVAYEGAVVLAVPLVDVGSMELEGDSHHLEHLLLCRSLPQAWIPVLIAVGRETRRKASEGMWKERRREALRR